MSYYLIIVCAISQVKQCLLISTNSQQYSAEAEIQIAHQLVEWIIYNLLSPDCAICFYRSLISSSKCCYVHVGCQKRSSEVLRCPADVGFTTKETRRREWGQDSPVLRPRASLPSLPLSLPAVTFVPEFLFTFEHWGNVSNDVCRKRRISTWCIDMITE